MNHISIAKFLHCILLLLLLLLLQYIFVIIIFTNTPRVISPKNVEFFLNSYLILAYGKVTPGFRQPTKVLKRLDSRF
jgi:hypothetical protein